MSLARMTLGFLITIAIITGCESSAQIIIDGDVILKGPIKSIEINTYKPNYRDSNITKGELVNSSGLTLMGGGGKLIFNEEGKRIGLINYKNGSTDPAYYVANEYSNGNVTKSYTYTTPSKEVLVDKIEREYDTENREVLTRYFEASYCEENQLWLTSKYNLEYNNHNDLIKQIDSSFVHYDCDDIRIRAKVREHHHKYENELKTEDDSYSYEYDKDGNLVKKLEKSNPTIYYEYYPSGVRKKKYLGPENYDEFDKDGYYKKSVVALRKGDEYIFRYSKYDVHGNWTQMIIYEDGRPYLIGERSITYYD